MSAHNKLTHLLNKFIAPKQDLAQLSFCRSAKEAQVKEWLQSLPMTQAQQVSAQLYTALHEISRLSMSSEQRLALLELLRVPVHHTLNGLTRKYLNQPLILPEAALKTATISQAIQKHFLNNYLILVQQLCQKIELKPEVKALQAQVIERALAALGLLMLRSYQLYLPIASQLWSDLHTLYQLACELNVAHQPINDQQPYQHHLKTIHNHYLRLLLLATARPNQLRQDEIETTYKLLENLAASAELTTYDAAGKDNLFVVLTQSNRPPCYKSHWRPGTSDTSSALELHTQQLLAQLGELYRNAGDTNTQGASLSAALAKHLEQAWSHLALRSFERQDINADIEVTVGLTNIHFYLAGEQAFNVFLNHSNGVATAPDKGDIFQKRAAQLKNNALQLQDDPWGGAFDIKGTPLEGYAQPTSSIEKKLLEREQEDYQGQHPIYKVPLVDRSLGGYGLEWRSEIPLQVRTGELLGLREYGRNKWSIGVVRWAHQIKGATQLGIQILAPHAEPLGIAIVHKTGGHSEYLRALQIPELRAINQPASVLTNAISFHEYSKARLYSPPPEGSSYSGDKSIQLTQRLFATGAFSQFGFRELLSTTSAPPSQDGINSTWHQ